MTTITISNVKGLKRTSFRDFADLFEYARDHNFYEPKTEAEEDFPTCFEDLDFRELEPHEVTPEIAQLAEEARNTPKENLIRI